MAFELPELPFAYDALQPYMSSECFEFHHDKHHAAYVTNGNNLLEGSGFEDKTLEEIIVATSKDAAKIGLFNNAAQHWNHSFFWNCLKPNGGGTSLPAAVQTKIDSDLGGYEKFKADFVDACVTQFGSGWGWLALNSNGNLEIMKTANADTPMAHGKTALLTCDVWEHAYYIDYRNARPKYVEAFIDSMINWDFVSEQLKKGPVQIAA
jgi:Fe-Mn family superoxide dismutase